MAVNRQLKEETRERLSQLLEDTRLTDGQICGLEPVLCHESVCFLQQCRCFLHVKII